MTSQTGEMNRLRVRKGHIRAHRPEKGCLAPKHRVTARQCQGMPLFLNGLFSGLPVTWEFLRVWIGMEQLQTLPLV